MQSRDIIITSGIILACIFLLICCLVNGKKKKYVLMIGAIVDMLLFAYCQNIPFLLVGMFGGLIFGVFPSLANKRKYDMALNELEGKSNLIFTFMIFFTMIFMIFAIACPDVKISWT